MLTRRQKVLGLAGALTFGMLLALGVTEAGLRIAGFEFHPFPVVQFGWPEPAPLQQFYESDPDLLWVTRNYREVLELARQHRPAVVFMGDSCTQFGTYPSKTLQLLAAAHPSLGRGIKVGVAGWSVVQGNWQLTRDVLPLHPHVVTIYYGWNDHWIALGPPDAEIRRARVLTWLADHLRIVQLLGKVREGLAGSTSERPNRVDLATYETTLVRMVMAVHETGAQAVLITAASNHTPGAEPDYLRKRHLRRLQDLVPMHQAYVEATRRAAAATGAVLCDAAADFAALPPPHGRFFRRDGIHLTEAGDRELARLLAGCIETAAGQQQFH
jgi:lysophospholipase L1-like esterase